MVGLPLTLRGERGAAGRGDRRFVEALRGAVAVPVETYDERFTTTLASRDPAATTPEDAAPPRICSRATSRRRRAR